jgi:ATP-dependent DNA ligase
MPSVFDPLPADERRQLRRSSQPARFEPMKATLAKEPFDDEEWIFERKLDGVCCIAYRDGKRVRLLSRTAHELNRSYPELVEAIAAERCQDFVVGGFTAPKGARTDFGALLVGYYADGGLRYAGKVGTGFDQRTLRELGAQLRALEREEPPFDDDVRPRPAGVRWMRPELVAQIAFSEWTRDGRLRQPRYLGLRQDKPPRDVVRERPS